MIRLIINEYKKINKFKLLFSYILVISIIYLIVYLNRKVNSFDTIYSFIPFLSLLVSIIFGNIISNEINSGTIRIYLTKPYKRYKVVLSKLFIIYLYIIVLYIVTISSYCVFVNIYHNFSLNSKILIEVFYNFTPVFFIGSLCLFLSCTTNSGALSTGLSIIISLSSNLISQILYNFNVKFISYTFLPYLEFNILKNKEYINHMQSLGVYLNIKNAIFILIVYSM